jgi:simple sugar transport system permease protein
MNDKQRASSGTGSLSRRGMLRAVGATGLGAAVASLAAGCTSGGNWITATGGSREAATARGIRTGRLTVGLFITAAVLAGLAGIISDTWLNLAYPTSGTGYELQAIAIAVVGGTSLFGGYGTIAGTVIGALLLQEISNGVVLVGVPAWPTRCSSARSSSWRCSCKPA